MYKNEKNIYIITNKSRIVCCDGYEKEPADYISYDSKKDFIEALEKEKTRKIGGTFFGEN